MAEAAKKGHNQKELLSIIESTRPLIVTEDEGTALSATLPASARSDGPDKSACPPLGMRVSPPCSRPSQNRRFRWGSNQGNRTSHGGWGHIIGRSLQKEKEMKKMRHLRSTAVAGLVLVISSGALMAADRDQPGQLSEGDYRFVKEAASGGMYSASSRG